jgi:predicted metal-dependent hydrolase
MERAEVLFGHTSLAYAVHRSARRETVSILVSPQQGVVLRAPAGVSKEKLANVVRGKAPWILRQLRRQRGFGRVAGKEFVSGETFHYLGRQYRLRVVADAREVKLKDGWLQAPSEHTRARVVAWYRQRAEERLVARTQLWATLMRLTVPRVLVRQQAMRWGSCDSMGNLRLNWRIVQAQMSLIDYVIVHELVHLRHRNHDASFWRELGRVMPDYEARRALLKLLGPELEW